jgi:hypothetical protein
MNFREYQNSDRHQRNQKGGQFDCSASAVLFRFVFAVTPLYNPPFALLKVATTKWERRATNVEPGTARPSWTPFSMSFVLTALFGSSHSATLNKSKCFGAPKRASQIEERMVIRRRVKHGALHWLANWNGSPFDVSIQISPCSDFFSYPVRVHRVK